MIRFILMLLTHIFTTIYANPASESYQYILNNHKQAFTKRILMVDITTQSLIGFQKNQKVFSYPIATAKKGTGQKTGSYQTPLGLHTIHRKIGDKSPVNMIFKGRKAIGEIFNTNKHDPQDDWVTTRILHLKGLEKGYNSGPGVDSYTRLIYIHGTPFEDSIGTPSSKGCIRMKNQDIIHLFDAVDEGDWVYIFKS